MVSEPYVAREKIIVNEKYLSPEIYPGFPLGRERQIAQLQECLKPIQRGQVPHHAWLYGPPGSGKTQITRYLVEKYCANTRSLTGIYVNCWHRRSVHSVLQEIIGQLKLLETEVQDSHLKFTRLRQALQEKMTIIILDEIDRPLPSERNAIIYQILQLPRTGLICISGNPTAYFELDQRYLSAGLFGRDQPKAHSVVFFQSLVTVCPEIDTFTGPGNIVLSSMFVVRQWIRCWSTPRHITTSNLNSKV